MIPRACLSLVRSLCRPLLTYPVMGIIPNEQILIGVVVSVLCLAGLVKDRWFLEHTRKGQWLTRRLGPTRAVWALRGLFSAGAVFGILLATNVIHPVRW